MELDSAVALVTGGASGLGLAVARDLARRGARPVLLDLDEGAGRAAADDLGGVFVRADVASEADVTAAVDEAAALGDLRVVVNAAGISESKRTVGRDGTPLELAAFDKHLRVNLLGTFNVCRLAASRIAATEPGADGARGAIVNFASVAAFDGQVGQVAYAASKGGVVGMTLPLARDLAAVGIRVNTVVPGLFDTPIYGSGPEAEEFKARLGKDVLFPRRLGRPEELASLVGELVTNDYVNAEIVRVDGGIRMPAK